MCYRKLTVTSHANKLSNTGHSESLGSVRLLLAFDRVARVAPGLSRLRARGLITDREYDTLVSVALPPSRWYLVVLEWIACRIVKARREGGVVGGHGFEQLVLSKVCDLRGACMTIPDELAARMPLAYVHFTHCLVDILLLIAPFGLYANLGASQHAARATSRAV